MAAARGDARHPGDVAHRDGGEAGRRRAVAESAIRTIAPAICERSGDGAGMSAADADGGNVGEPDDSDWRQPVRAGVIAELAAAISPPAIDGTAADGAAVALTSG